MSFIKNVPMQDLIAAPENPFKVTMDSEMERLIESIALSPRPLSGPWKMENMKS